MDTYLKDALDRVHGQLLVEHVELGGALRPELSLARTGVVHSVLGTLFFSLDRLFDLVGPFSLHEGSRLDSGACQRNNEYLQQQLGDSQ